MARVLITGGRAPAALELARLFAAAGHTVFAADSTPWMLCGASRAVTKAFRVPEPRRHPRDFANRLAGIAREQRIDLILPTCEEVFYVGRFKSELERHAKVFCADLTVLERLHSKAQFADLVLRENGFGTEVRAPESWVVRTRSDLDTLSMTSEELVLKPVFSRFATATLIRPDAARMRGIALDRPWLAQRCIAGTEFCSYSVCRDGAVQAHAVYRPAWRAGKGAGIYFEPHAIPEIERFVSGLARHFHLTGQVAFDFIVEASGRVFVLECNPRATSGVHLFDAALATAFTGATDIVRAGHGPRMMASAMALLGPGQALATGRLLPFCRDFARARDVIWSWRDPMPVFTGLLSAAAFTWKGFRHRVSAEAATTLDIEWDGEVIA
jgi:hypothetical protein